jgi:hypothetical protein
LQDSPGISLRRVLPAGLDDQLEIAGAAAELFDCLRTRGAGGAGAAGLARRPRAAQTRIGFWVALLAENGLEFVAIVATVAAGATVAGDVAGVAPASERVQTDAEELGGGPESQPATVSTAGRDVIGLSLSGVACVRDPSRTGRLP